MKSLRNTLKNKQNSLPIIGTLQGVLLPPSLFSKENPRKKRFLQHLTHPFVRILFLFSLTFFLGCQTLSPLPSTSTTFDNTINTISSPPLGETIENPIPMTSILASMNYLDRLVWDDNTPVQWERINSIKCAEPLPPPTTPWEKTKDFLGLRKVPGPILDCYRLSGPKHPEKNLWINPYAKENYTLPPKGLKFR